MPASRPTSPPPSSTGAGRHPADPASVQSPFAAVTPAGAFHAVAGSGLTPERSFLISLLKGETFPAIGRLGELYSRPPGQSESMIPFALRLKARGWLAFAPAPERCPSGSLEGLLPGLLPLLSERRQALLADGHGLPIASVGFDASQSQGIAAVAADALALALRCGTVLGGPHGSAIGAWGLIDGTGRSRLGVWPLFVGPDPLALVLAGQPALNHPDFLRLVWVLIRRLDADRGGSGD